jgi:RecA-family ATPase
VSTSTELQTISLENLLKMQFAKRQYLLEPWLYTRHSVMVWAAPAVGKTFFTLSLALAIAGGGEFLGWKAPGKKRVLVLDGEMDLQDLQDRLQGLAQGMKALDLQAAGSNITVCARQHQKHDVVFPDIATEQGQDEILQRAIQGRFDLVILDNFSTLADVPDENSAASMSPVLNFLLRLKQAKIATVLVHHANKGGLSFRGSSKLAATFEVILGLTKNEKALTQKGVSFKLAWEKYRGRQDDSTKAMDISLPQTEGVMRWEHTISDDEQCERLLAFLNSGDYISQDELAAAMQVSKGQISKLKTKLHVSNRCSKQEFARRLNAAREARTEEGLPMFAPVTEQAEASV